MTINFLYKILFIVIIFYILSLIVMGINYMIYKWKMKDVIKDHTQMMREYNKKLDQKNIAGIK